MSRMVAIAIGLAGLAAGCAQSDSEVAPQADSTDSTETGTLEFRANGEDFVRQGFVSKDGWQIDFEHLYVTLFDLKAYQTDSAYDPDVDKEISASPAAQVSKETTVDLAEGDEEAAPVLVESVTAPAGQYDALSWNMAPATSGPSEGSTLMMVGTAAKDGETIPFTLRLDPEYTYTCGEFVGDARKGILQSGEQADVEATFHFDHVFGDGDAPADDSINTGAVGFEPFAALASNGELDVDQAELEQALSPQDYSTLEEALVGLGHVGEGHCAEASAQHTHQES
ncbi:MAG: DUF4382 domain-containing protein [Elainellaceae cyanobacterium]